MREFHPFRHRIHLRDRPKIAGSGGLLLECPSANWNEQDLRIKTSKTDSLQQIIINNIK